VREPSQRQAGAPKGTAVAGLTDFEQCFEVNFAVVHRFITRRVGAPLADDLAAEVFATAFRRRHSFDPGRGPARAWLLGIANNLVREHWRAEQRLLSLSSRLEAEPGPIGREPGPEEHVAASGLAPRVARALACLPAAQRDVLLLHAWGGLSQQEIAAALGLPRATVRSRLWRARGALRPQLLAPRFDLGPPVGCAGEGSPGLEAKYDLPGGDEHGR
jgi:RNA polymerase sigma factor (sigma-70 family)